MIRNLKALMLAAMALAAFGVTFASAAQAAEPKFHCSVEPCTFTAKPDLKPEEKLPSKTAHQVFIVRTSTGESLSFTCEQITGAGTAKAKTSTELELGTVEEIKYDGCLAAGSTQITITPNGCKYNFSSTAGTMSITGCNTGKKIEVSLSTGGIYTIGEQGPLSKVSYHSSGQAPGRELTVEANVTGIAISCDGTKAQTLLDCSKPLVGEFTTGNTLVTGETDPGGVMAEAWFE